MTSIDSDANVYLVPASSPEDQKLLELLLDRPGFDRTDVEPKLVNHGSLEADVHSAEQRIENLKDELDALDSQSDLDDDQRERRQTLRNDLGSAQSRMFETEQELASAKTVLDRARTDFDELQEAVGGNSGPVQCWPVDSRLGEQYQFSAGDLLLFYTGNELYEYAATLNQTVELETLGNILVRDDDRSRRLFLVFSEVYTVQVDSSVLAEITDRELASVQQISPVSGASLEELTRRFGSLREFVNDARSGIKIVPPKPASDSDHSWTFDDSEDGGRISAEGSSTVPGASSAPGDAVETGIERTDETATLELPEATQTTNWRALADTLVRAKQVVLVGPQGTGKRQAVERLLSEWLGSRGSLSREERILRTQFTSDTDYQEFVHGWSGITAGSEHLVTGPFGRFVDLAAAETTQFTSRNSGAPPKFVAVIEDFQAVDPVGVFGDFWQALRPQNRGPEYAVRVSGTDATLWLPEELYVIGIVDTNDAPPRGALELTGSPFTVRRTCPDLTALREAYGYSGQELIKTARDGSFDALSILAVEQLNERIRDAAEFDDRHVLGQRFLSRGSGELDPYRDEGLYRAWQYEILSVLAGYHRDGLSGLIDELFADTTFADKGRRLALGSVHSSPELVRDLVEGIATTHPDY